MAWTGSRKPPLPQQHEMVSSDSREPAGRSGFAMSWPCMAAQQGIVLHRGGFCAKTFAEVGRRAVAGWEPSRGGQL